MAQLRIKQDGGFGFSTDDWDGYPANRARLLKRIHDSQVSNPVVIGGDSALVLRQRPAARLR